MRSATPGILAIAMLLGGCATMSESECLTVDWQTIGFEDGVAGYSGDRIGQHRGCFGNSLLGCTVHGCYEVVGKFILTESTQRRFGPLKPGGEWDANIGTLQKTVGTSQRLDGFSDAHFQGFLEAAGDLLLGEGEGSRFLSES